MTRRLLVLALVLWAGSASAQPAAIYWRPPTCTVAGQTITWSGSAWTCGSPYSTAGAGLTASGTTVNVIGAVGGGISVLADSIGLLTTCSSGEILKWGGSSWACAADDTVGSGAVGGTGTAGTMAKWTGVSTIADSLLSDDGTTLSYNAGKFTVLSASGNTTIAGTLAVTGAVTDGGARVYSIAGDGLTSSGATVNVVGGSGITVAANSVTYDSAVIQSRVSGTCVAPNSILSIGVGGTVTCTTAALDTSNVSGTSGKSARFSSTNVLGNGAFTDDGTNATIAGTFGVTGLLTATAGGTTAANWTTTGTGDLVSADDLTVADDATITSTLGVGTTAALLSSSVIEAQTAFQSLITFGDSTVGSGNPQITMYRTSGGARQGTGVRLFMAASLFNFRIQQGTNDTAYGSETYTDRFVIDANGTGIGPDTTPDFYLDVQGTLGVDGAATFGSTIATTGAITENGAAVLSGAITDGAIPMGSSGNLVDSALGDDGTYVVTARRGWFSKDTNSFLQVGYAASNTTNGQNSFQFLTDGGDGNAYIETKAASAKGLVFSIGQGTEPASTRNWLTVTGSTGATNFAAAGTFATTIAVNGNAVLGDATTDATTINGTASIIHGTPTAVSAPAGTVLQIDQANGTANYVSLRGQNADAKGYIFTNASNALDGGMTYTAQALGLRTANSTRIAVDSTGGVLMGTTGSTASSATIALTVGGNLQATKLYSETQVNDHTRGYEIYEEFMSYCRDFIDGTYASTHAECDNFIFDGGYDAPYAETGGNHPGVIKLSGSTSVATISCPAGSCAAPRFGRFVQGWYDGAQASGDVWYAGGGTTKVAGLFQIVGLASPPVDDTDSYTFHIGLYDNNTKNGATASYPPNGIYCSVASGSTNVQACTSKAGTKSCTDTSPAIAIAEDAWIRCEFTVNAAGTNVDFTVTNVTAGTSGTASRTTQIPNTASNLVGLGATVDTIDANGVGAVLVDYVWMDQTFTTAR